MNYLYKNYLIYIFYLNIFHKKIIKYIKWRLRIGDLAQSQSPRLKYIKIEYNILIKFYFIISIIQFK